MNILVLTPDRVGSTLLQRLVTVYANINENYDPLTVNLHELTNGIASYHNETFNRTVLGKKEGHWGYHQSLETVVNLLKTCGHDVTSRLAHYHIKNRKDSLASQLDFYKYLNENFYIIAAKRKNLFEHVMSWCISVESKKLNVYSSEEKFNTFKHMQQHGITVQAENIEKYLNQYQEYLTWVDSHFQVNSYFEYDRDLPNIEDFILNLNIFNSTTRPLTWQDRFDISWNNWNRMHYLLSLVQFDNIFSAEENDFIAQHIETYSQSRIELQDLQDQGVLVSGIPIKLHTLTEKAKIIRNIDQCLEYYNNWIGVNQPTFAVPYNPDTLNNIAQLEYSKWNSIDRNLVITVPSKLILQADLKFS
jgi:hypothetical protein